MSRNFIFLHGGIQGGWVWEETMAAMHMQQAGKPLGRLLALDVPGCGSRRGQDTAGVKASDIVDTLIADVVAAGIDDAVLVGHSQAGTIMPLMIKARPDLFRHAAYVSCLAPTGVQTALNWRADMPDVGSMLSLDPAAMPRERYRAMFCNDMHPGAADAFLDRVGPDNWPASSYRMSGWSYDHLDACPSTYIVCLRDATLPPAWQEIFAERLRVNEIVRIDAGHQAMNTRPHALAEILHLLDA